MMSWNTANHPIFEDGLVFVSIEGDRHRRAVVHRSDFLRITAHDYSGYRLTRTRWWLDDAGLVRAFSLHERAMAHGVLVAAAILNASEGDTIATPADPFDLRLSGLHRVAV